MSKLGGTSGEKLLNMSGILPLTNVKFSYLSLLPAESPINPLSYLVQAQFSHQMSFAHAGLETTSQVGSCVSKIDLSFPSTKPFLITHVPSLPFLGGGSQKLRASPSSSAPLPSPRFRAFQFRMAAVDEYAHQTPMRRRQAFFLVVLASDNSFHPISL